MATAVTSKIRFREPQIEMAHGAGGKASRRLIEGLFVPLLCESSSAILGDAALIQLDGVSVGITTDSSPIEPPGKRSGFTTSSR
jgi:hydrogenase expression/formation protein HypE